MLLLRGPIDHIDITHSTIVTAAEHESDLKITTDTPYLGQTGELLGICCGDIGKNWPGNKDNTLYMHIYIFSMLPKAYV